MGLISGLTSQDIPLIDQERYKTVYAYCNF